MYTHRVARPRALRARHSVENQWDLLESLGVRAPSPRSLPGRDAVDAGAAASLAARLARAGIPPGDRLVVIHVSAGNPFRRWPIASFGQVAAAWRRARRRRQRSSSRRDRPSVRRRSGDRRGRASAERRTIASASWHCGDFSLAELRALVDRAALYIGGDSGPHAHRRHEPRADGLVIRADAAGSLGAVAVAALADRQHSKSPASTAGRATSGSACPATSAA